MKKSEWYNLLSEAVGEVLDLPMSREKGRQIHECIMGRVRGKLRLLKGHGKAKLTIPDLVAFTVRHKAGGKTIPKPFSETGETIVTTDKKSVKVRAAKIMRDTGMEADIGAE